MKSFNRVVLLLCLWILLLVGNGLVPGWTQAKEIKKKPTKPKIQKMDSEEIKKQKEAEQKEKEEEEKQKQEEGKKEEEEKKEKEKQEQILKEKIQDNISILKFEEETLKKKEALNFLFEHIEKAKTLLYQELLEKDNPDLFLANIFNILSYGLKEMDIQKLFESAQIQEKKPNYIYYLFAFLYEKFPERIIPLIRRDLEETSLDMNITALKLIQKKKIEDLKDYLMGKVFSTDSQLIAEMILETLRSLKLERKDLQRLSYFMRSIDEGVRNAAVGVFRLYPDMLAYLIERFEDSDDFFEKISIIDTLVYYDNAKADYFLILLLVDDFFRAKVLDAYLLRSRDNLQVVERLISIYERSGNVFLKASVPRILSFIYRDIIPLGKEGIISFMKRELRRKQEEDILYNFAKAVYYMGVFDPELLEIFKEIRKSHFSWRVRKVAAQILDLTKKN